MSCGFRESGDGQRRSHPSSSDCSANPLACVWGGGPGVGYGPGVAAVVEDEDHVEDHVVAHESREAGGRGGRVPGQQGRGLAPDVYQGRPENGAVEKVPACRVRAHASAAAAGCPDELASRVVAAVTARLVRRHQRMGASRKRGVSASWATHMKRP